MWVHLSGWRFLICPDEQEVKTRTDWRLSTQPGQKCSLHPWERFPSLLCHPGHSTGGRTLGLHVAPLVDGQGPWKCAHVVTCVTWLWKIGLPDVIKSVYAWTEATMQAEDLSVHKGSQGKVVKEVSEVPAMQFNEDKRNERIVVSSQVTHFHTLALPYFLRHSS